MKNYTRKNRRNNGIASGAANVLTTTGSTVGKIASATGSAAGNIVRTTGKAVGNIVSGGGKMLTVGSKSQVYHGTAKHTSGGLTKKDLMKTKKGRIVSKRKHAAGKKALKRLYAKGYKPKKGTFKLFH